MAGLQRPRDSIQSWSWCSSELSNWWHNGFRTPGQWWVWCPAPTESASERDRMSSPKLFRSNGLTSQEGTYTMKYDAIWCNMMQLAGSAAVLASDNHVCTVYHKSLESLDPSQGSCGSWEPHLKSLSFSPPLPTPRRQLVWYVHWKKHVKVSRCYFNLMPNDAETWIANLENDTLEPLTPGSKTALELVKLRTAEATVWEGRWWWSVSL